MNKSLLKRILRPVYAALGIALVVMVFRGIFAAEGLEQYLSILSDGFYIAGVLLISSFLLRMVNREGSFDMVAYNLRLMFPMGEDRYSDHVKKDAYTYMEEKREKRAKKDRGFPTLFVGLACLALATVFLVLYRNVQ